MFRGSLLFYLTLLALLPCALLAQPPPVFEVDKPPGQRYDVGGFKLHINCMGQGSPVVVLDAGVGGFSLEWMPVQKALSEHTKVCAYDRAGYGWSDMGPLPRTTAHISYELHQLLHAAQLKPPYILVGHSFGGYSVQHFARSYPEEVAGMVLVDSSHPEQVERLPTTQKQRRRTAIPGGRSVYMLPRVQLHPNYPEAYVPIAHQLLSSWKSILTVREEMLNFKLSADQVRSAGELPDVPLLVLTRGLRVWPYNDYGDAMEVMWMTLQDELAQLEPKAVHLIAEQSGHSIHMDEPGLVINAVGTMFNRIDNDAVAGR